MQEVKSNDSTGNASFIKDLWCDGKVDLESTDDNNLKLAICQRRSDLALKWLEKHKTTSFKDKRGGNRVHSYISDALNVEFCQLRLAKLKDETTEYLQKNDLQVKDMLDEIKRSPQEMTKVVDELSNVPEYIQYLKDKKQTDVSTVINDDREYAYYNHVGQENGNLKYYVRMCDKYPELTKHDMKTYIMNYWNSKGVRK